MLHHSRKLIEAAYTRLIAIYCMISSIDIIRCSHRPLKLKAPLSILSKKKCEQESPVTRCCIQIDACLEQYEFAI